MLIKFITRGNPFVSCTLNKQNYNTAMKKNLLTVLSLTACLTAFSQEEVNPTLRNTGATEQSPAPSTISPVVIPTKVVSQSKSVTISKRAGQPQRVHNEAYYLEEIAKIDNNLAAIDQKIALVNADPNEKQLALTNGWFQDMENIKNDLKLKKTSLQEKLATL